ncbi:MAG TPA: hypothetical protein VNZ43_07095 [Sphingomonadaceae bacterium]|jgi:hypothetical protein|nr:hypothetical protein [Sphingomonadaceae bacterium]
MIRALPLLTILLLAGCGQKETLRPAPGAALPPKPAMAPTQPSPTELLTPTTTERPERSDELLKQSEERPVDRFNLPPSG